MNNPNYNNNNFNRNNFTFQNNLHFSTPILPPPPPPPVYLSPPVSDQDYVRSFENKVCEVKKNQPEKISLSKLNDKIRTLITAYNNIKNQEEQLNANVDIYSEEQWKCKLEDVENNKSIANNILSELNGPYLDLSRKALAKRTAQRLRLKKRRQLRKKEREEQIKEREERSRLIDENLKKINDDILKAKQEEEAKQQADIVLKDVLRKKYEAKKNINKLDALIKLRKARVNTAKGRGISVCENEAATFHEHIEKLKVMWVQKLAMYETEEGKLRSKLAQSNKNECSDSTDAEIKDNLRKWHQVMFGSADYPQVDFRGDIQKFVAVRSEWDQYLSSTGTVIPLGWVVPTS